MVKSCFFSKEVFNTKKGVSSITYIAVVKIETIFLAGYIILLTYSIHTKLICVARIFFRRRSLSSAIMSRVMWWAMIKVELFLLSSHSTLNRISIFEIFSYHGFCWLVIMFFDLQECARTT